MLKTTQMIMDELHNYASPADKLSRLVKSGVYTPVTHGLYETDAATPGHLLAGSIYGPSYLSFEYALDYYSLIPEAVYVYTCATFEKKKKKLYTNHFGTYTFRDVPSAAYPYGLKYKQEGEYAYIIASPEKAICDRLYLVPPVNNYRQLEELLFEDLRFDDEDLANLSAADIRFLAAKYPCTNVKRFSKWLEKRHR